MARLRTDQDHRTQERETDTQAHQSRRERAARQLEERQNQVQARIGKKRTHNLAVKGLDDLVEGEIPAAFRTHHVGPMNQRCGDCNALKFNGETPSLCCNGGQVQLPPIRSPPEELIGHLFNDENHGHTMKYIKYMNSLCSLASVAVKEARVPGYNPTYKIEGVMHHRIGALRAREGKRVKHLQVFFAHPNEPQRELEARLAQFEQSEAGNDGEQDNDAVANYQAGVRRRQGAADQLATQKIHAAVELFQGILHECNPYVLFIKSALELNVEMDLKVVLHHDRQHKPQGHERTWNLPTCDEVAVILAEGDQQGDVDRDIVIHLKGQDGAPDTVEYIKSYHRSYDALFYTLLLPYGDDGWQLGLKTAKNRTLTAAMFYRFHLHIRQGMINHLLRCGHLSQQFCLDMFVKVEEGRLRYCRNNQTHLKAAAYNAVLDATCVADLANNSRKIILPPSVTGSPRFFIRAYQDCMAIVR